MSFKSFIGTIGNGLSKHSPEILVGLGIAGMVTGTIMAVKATPKALVLMEEINNTVPKENKKERGKEIATKVGKVYLPALGVEMLSIACIIGGTSVNLRRSAMLATAYSLSESTLREYQAKVIEEVGESKEKHIRDEIAKDKMQRNPVTNNEVYITAAGNQLCYDSISGRYFTSDIEKLRSIQNDLNERMMTEMYISLNELYYEIGLRCTEQGNDLGFNMEDGLIKFEFSAQLADDGRPCIVLGYRVGPRFGYGDLH